MTVEVFGQITLGDLLRRHRKDANLSQKALGQLLIYSDAVVSRVENGDLWPVPVYVDRFVALTALALTSEQRELILRLYQQGKNGPVVEKRPFHTDWGEAPDVSVFYGRENALETLHTWVVQDRCRLVGVLGMGGMGKTWVVTRLAHDIAADFEVVLWRSLRNAPPCEEMVHECLQILSDQQIGEPFANHHRAIGELVKLLQQKRCLLVMDNVEAILEPGFNVGQYRTGYELYGELWQRVGETNHQSCVILTSREQPKTFVRLASHAGGVRVLALDGFGVADGRALLRDRALRGETAVWTTFIQRYAGNPLALRTISASIEMLYGGDILTFLQEITTMFGEINFLLQQQFERLSPLEKDLMLWLAIVREPVSIPELQKLLVQPVSTAEVAEALASLARRSLIEVGNGRFTLQNVIMEFMTAYLIERVCEEIAIKRLKIFNSHLLFKADSKEYIRISQKRLILEPASEKLLLKFGKDALVQHLMSILQDLPHGRLDYPGYMGGNIINLFVLMGIPLETFDFSGLVIRQADLRGISLLNADFSSTHFIDTIFSESFGPITAVAYREDDGLLVAGSISGVIRLWDLAKSKMIGTLEGHTYHVKSLVFSPLDNNILASSGDDRSIRIWNIAQQACLFVLADHQDTVNDIKFTPDGKWLISGSRDQTIRIWDIEQGICLKTIDNHQSRITNIINDKNRILVAEDNGTILFLNTETGNYLPDPLKCKANLTTAALSPDCCFLAISLKDGEINIWDIHQKKIVHHFYGHTRSGTGLAFSPDNRFLASGSGDQTIRIWDVRSGNCVQVLTGHHDTIMSMVYTADGKNLISGSYDQTVRVWHTETWKCVKKLEGFTKWGISLTSEPNNHKIIAGGGYDGKIKLWDSDSGKCIHILKGHRGTSRPVIFSPDGQLLASGGVDNLIKMWDLPSRQLISVFEGLTGWPRAICFLPDKGLIAASGYDPTIYCWEMETGRLTHKFQGHTSQVFSLTYKNGILVSGGGERDGEIKFWDIEKNACIDMIDTHSSRVRTLAFHPIEDMLLSGSDDQTIGLFQLFPARLIKQMNGHTDWVQQVCFNHDGTLFVSGGYDGNLKVWSTNNGECMYDLKADKEWVLYCQFISENHLLTVNGFDSFQIWDVTSGKRISTVPANRLYENMNISDAKGLSPAQIRSLMRLGAVDQTARAPVRYQNKP